MREASRADQGTTDPLGLGDAGTDVRLGHEGEVDLID